MTRPGGAALAIAEPRSARAADDKTVQQRSAGGGHDDQAGAQATNARFDPVVFTAARCYLSLWRAAFLSNIDRSWKDIFDKTAYYCKEC